MFLQGCLRTIERESLGHCLFLDTVLSTHESSWLAKLQLCEQEAVLVGYTGSEVTAISELTYQSQGKQKLVSPGKALYGPSRQPLKVVRQFEGKFAYKNKTTVQTVYVVNGLKTCSYAIMVDGQPPERVQSYKYLGVHIPSDLSWSNHVSIVRSRAKKQLGMLYRRFYRDCEPTTLRMLYISDHC